MPTRGNRNVGRGPTAPSYTGPGDIVSGAVSWWGLRGYSAAKVATAPYAAIDIVDSGGGNAATVNILSTGHLDNATLNAWISANGTAFVSKVYDQIATANHLVQATVSKMPTIAQSIFGTEPAFSFDGSARYFNSASGASAQSTPVTISCVYKMTDCQTPANIQYLFYANTSDFWPDNGQPAGGPANPILIGSLQVSKFPTTINTKIAVQGVFNGASSDLNFNGVSKTGDTGTSGWAASTFIGVGASSATGGPATAGRLPYLGHLTEIGYWSTAFDASSQSTPMASNQQTFWGF